MPRVCFRPFLLGASSKAPGGHYIEENCRFASACGHISLWLVAQHGVRPLLQIHGRSPRRHRHSLFVGPDLGIGLSHAEFRGAATDYMIMAFKSGSRPSQHPRRRANRWSAVVGVAQARLQAQPSLRMMWGRLPMALPCMTLRRCDRLCGEEAKRSCC